MTTKPLSNETADFCMIAWLIKSNVSHVLEQPTSTQAILVVGEQNPFRMDVVVLYLGRNGTRGY